MEKLLLEKTNELIDLMKQHEKDTKSAVRDHHIVYSLNLKLNEYVNYLKCRLDNDIIKGDELSFIINDNESIPVRFHNKKYVAIEKESDYDCYYIKCFDCAMYNHTFKNCLRCRGFKIPNCEADQRKDGKSVIYKEDKN